MAFAELFRFPFRRAVERVGTGTGTESFWCSGYKAIAVVGILDDAAPDESGNGGDDSLIAKRRPLAKSSGVDDAVSARMTRCSGVSTDVWWDGAD